MKLSPEDLFSKIRSFLRIWSHLLKKSLMENFIFYAVISLITTHWILQDFLNLEEEELMLILIVC